MTKKTYYYKFLIKINRKLSKIEIAEIKRAIQRILIDTAITDIHGGIANNNGYQKFGVENENKAQQIKC